jgi:hypothetical protein
MFRAYGRAQGLALDQATTRALLVEKLKDVQ